MEEKCTNCFTLEYLFNCVSKPLLKCQSKIMEKIFRIASLVNDSMAMTLKWRRNLELMSLRPPPGGPMAATINMSTMFIVDVSFLDKHQNNVLFKGLYVILLWVRGKIFLSGSANNFFFLNIYLTNSQVDN